MFRTILRYAETVWLVAVFAVVIVAVTVDPGLAADDVFGKGKKLLSDTKTGLISIVETACIVVAVAAALYMAFTMRFQPRLMAVAIVSGLVAWLAEPLVGFVKSSVGVN